jgi:hypothetical protein
MILLVLPAPVKKKVCRGRHAQTYYQVTLATNIRSISLKDLLSHFKTKKELIELIVSEVLAYVKSLSGDSKKKIHDNP